MYVDIIISSVDKCTITIIVQKDESDAHRPAADLEGFVYQSCRWWCHLQSALPSQQAVLAWVAALTCLSCSPIAKSKTMLRWYVAQLQHLQWYKLNKQAVWAPNSSHAQATDTQNSSHIWLAERDALYMYLLILCGEICCWDAESALSMMNNVVTLQKAMMSPIIQLAAGLATAPAASTASKYCAVGRSSDRTSTSAAGSPSSLYFLLYSAGRAGMEACSQYWSNFIRILSYSVNSWLTFILFCTLRKQANDDWGMLVPHTRHVSSCDVYTLADKTQREGHCTRARTRQHNMMHVGSLSAQMSCQSSDQLLSWIYSVEHVSFGLSQATCNVLNKFRLDLSDPWKLTSQLQAGILGCLLVQRLLLWCLAMYNLACCDTNNVCDWSIDWLLSMWHPTVSIQTIYKKNFVVWPKTAFMNTSLISIFYRKQSVGQHGLRTQCDEYHRQCKLWSCAPVHLHGKRLKPPKAANLVLESICNLPIPPSSSCSWWPVCFHPIA